MLQLGEKPQICWPKTTYAAETMSAWRHDVHVTALPTLEFPATKNMEKQVCEKYQVLQSTDGQPGALLVYNQHQPASKHRRFTPEQRKSMAEEVLRDAKTFHESHKQLPGLHFRRRWQPAGDALASGMCARARLETVFQEPTRDPCRVDSQNDQLKL